jgi:hypothetical protein
MKKGIGPRGLGSPFKQTTKDVAKAVKKVAPLVSIPAGVAQGVQAAARTAASAGVQGANKIVQDRYKKAKLQATAAAGQAAREAAEEAGTEMFRSAIGMGPNAYGQAQRPKSEVGQQFMKGAYALPASVQAQANKKNK